MMKEKIIAGIVVLFFSYSLTAQNIEVSLKTGGALSGFTKYNGWVKTPDQIEIDLDDQIKIFKPSDLHEFNVLGDRYVSRKVEINVNQQSMQNLRDFKNLESVEKEIFLKIIVEGDVSLYSYRDSRTHFFVQKGDKIVELIRLKRSTKSTLNQYIGQLNIFFSDCKEMSNKSNVQFSKTSLKRAVMEYNECKSGESSFVEKKHPIQMNVYLIGGLKSTSYDIANDNFYDNFEIEQTNSLTPAYGFGFDINLLRRTKKLQLYTEFLLQNYNFESSYRVQRLPEQFIDYFLDVDVVNLEITGMLRYNFGNDYDKVRFFSNAGINQAIQVSDASSEYSNSFFYGAENRTEREPLGGDILTSRMAFVLGAGVNYKFITAELRYGFNPRLSDYPNISNTSDLNFLVSVKVL